ncbi:tRNA 2-selenouridine(34) synthase MnmH [Azonexus hydrophilus]|uniref:tRNA 2-selenouridine(34) synthase MnmH n=1 Tax=Azonexus hydrophilus TaxID=418702 RepID=A0A1R1I1J3_9RHOO|nr:tRNA 2-selenouridine(34) synthase MnmH [Azonexus hydrophilus]OMG52577.1 tRNA 2-selenouridine(34) synthase MnmH [Azonexus hydrophilus]
MGAADSTRRRKGVATLDELGDFDTIIDVRSPAEFADDHIPGAISCPVLDDAQRAEVGTLYKQVSPFVAKKLGAAYISANIAGHLREHFLDRDKGWRPLIVCWRGGMRSGAMTTVFRSIGWDACQLDGGYKTFRTHVLAELETLPGQYRYQVLGGPTGSAKTRVLQAIAEQGGQVLDLEEIACHKGSVLGRLPGQPQPSQKWFETAIWQTLRNFDPARPVFVEAESRKIGNLRLPAELFTAMQSSPICEICADIPQRVDFLLRDYDYFTQDALNLKKHLDALRPLLGHERVNAWHEQIDQHDFAGLTGSLLQHHYDPLYARARQRDYSATPTAFSASTLDEAEIARLAATILDHAAPTTETAQA